MSRPLTLGAALLLVAACNDSKPDSRANAKATPSPSASPQPPTPATSQPAATPTPATGADPYRQGFCEVSVDGGAPTKTGGGAANVSTMHWAGPATKNPPWGLVINCGAINLSSDGPDDGFPMKAARYPIASGGDGPHVTVISPFGAATGELVIDRWDLSGIAGSFELRGSKDDKPVSVKGTFDFQCPYTEPGTPCLDKPASPPP